MNWLDLVFGLVIVISVFSGFRKGMVRIGIGFAATIAAFLLASWFYGTAGRIFAGVVASDAIANFLGFLLVFAGVLGVGALVSFLIGKALKLVGLSWADRALGGLFGLVRAALICVVFLMLVMAFPLGKGRAAAAESALAPYVIETSKLLSAATPNEIREGFRTSYETIQKIWSDATRKKSRKINTEQS
jgi:membrane protein required for colicin V production